MTTTKEATASCLCGEIKLTTKTMSLSVGACHCKMCRQWGGGPLIVSDCQTEVSIEGKDKLRVFDSSEWAERGFCSLCGSHLFYRLKQNQQYMVPVGLFSDDNDFVFDHEVFIDEQPNYYCFSNNTKRMTGDELIAEFTAVQ